MTSLLLPNLSTSSAVPTLLQLSSVVRRHRSGASPPNPWRPHPWHRWLPWWFR